MAKDKDKKESKVEKEDEAEEQEQAEKAKKDEPVDEAANPTQLQPYPQGQPPDPEDEFQRIHGFRRDGK